MQLRILGCSGGIGGERHTTSILVDDDVLIDCGTGVGILQLEEMRKLRHVFLTHTHLDHIASLPLLVDTLFSDLVDRPLVIHAMEESMEIIKSHIFNWQIQNFSLGAITAGEKFIPETCLADDTNIFYTIETPKHYSS